MKVVIAVDKNPTSAELLDINKAKKDLEDKGFTVELIGTRPNDR